MNIGKKLLVSFVLLILLVVVSGIIGIAYTGAINSKINQVTQVTSPASSQIEEMVSILWKSNYLVQRISTETDLDQIDVLEQDFEVLNAQFKDLVEDTGRKVSDVEIQNALESAEKKQDVFFKFAKKLIVKRKEEVFTGVESEDFYVKYSIFKQLEKDVVDAVVLLEGALVDLDAYVEAANQASKRAVRNTTFTLIFTSLVSIGLAVGLYAHLRRVITDPIKKLSGATSSLAKGHFETEVEVSSRDDELSELTGTFNEMVRSLKRVLEENPRLKRFVRISDPKKKDADAARYVMDARASYIIKDPSSLEAYEILLEKVGEGFKPLIVSRTNPRVVREKYGVTDLIVLSEEREKDVLVTSDAAVLQKKILEFISKHERSIVILDRIDYVILKNGFNRVLDMITKLNDVVMTRECILLLPIDPSIFNNQQLSMLEKELQRGPEQRIKRNVPEELLEVLRFIDTQEVLKKPVTYKEVGQHLHITAPTTLKRMNQLLELRLVSVSKIGRNKVIRLTREGKRAILNQ